MSSSSRSAVLAALLCALAPAARAGLPPATPPRLWTLPDGQTVNAAIVSADNGIVTLRIPGGRVVTIEEPRLAPADANYLRDWRDKQPVVLPETVGADASKLTVEVVREDDREGVYIYRTNTFEFTCDGKLTQSLLRDVARNFEATYELLKALPWGIEPAPESGDRFRAHLVRTRGRYHDLGGPENSGGVYYRSKGLFLIPFESLGIKPLGQSYAKSGDYTTDTLVHELTHQMMNAWLEILPQWVIEGTAEYTRILPLRFGIFRPVQAKSGLREYIASLKKTGEVPDPYPLDELFRMDNDTWNATLAKNPAEARRLYFTSYLLVYYFMHLAPPGDGSPFVHYLRSLKPARDEIAAYHAALDTFLHQPGVTVEPDGTIRAPSGLTPPERPPMLNSQRARDELQTAALNILRNGRTDQQLLDDIRSAYRRLGIKL